MAMRRTAVVVALVACSGGTAGNPEAATDAFERPGTGRDAPGTTRDSANDREAPPPSRDPPPPSQDPPSSGGAGTCLACQDQTYLCTGFIEGVVVNQGISVELHQLNGQCVTTDDQNGIIVTTTFGCGGTILNSSGVAIGTWAAATNGGIAVSLEGIQLTCAPRATTPPIVDAGGARDAR